MNRAYHPLVIDHAPETEPADISETAQELDLLCDSCGYSLLGITTPKCPECGREFDPDQLPLARVPWLHRKRFGTWRTYWRTVGMIILTPRKFVRELARPVRNTPLDAVRFRKLTVRLAALGTSGSAIIGFIIASLVTRLPSPLVNPMPLVILLGSLIVWYLALTMFLRLATDMPVFIWSNVPGTRAFDLAPVHHYAAAPMAFLPIIVLLALPIVWLMENQHNADGAISHLALACAIICALWLIVLWLIPVILMRASVRASVARMLMLALYLPFHYLAMAVVTAAMFIAAFGGIILVIGWLLKLSGISL